MRKLTKVDWIFFSILILGGLCWQFREDLLENVFNIYPLNGKYKTECADELRYKMVSSWMEEIEFSDNGLMTGMLGMVYQYKVKDGFVFYGSGEGTSQVCVMKIVDKNTIQGIGMFSGCKWVKLE